MPVTAAVDPRDLRHALGRFATGVTVVTTADLQGRPVGLTVNSFAAVSLDPPLVAWSLGARSRSLPAFLAAGCFAIHVLDAAQEPLSQRFAAPAEDRFAGIDRESGTAAAPLLPGCLARFECSTHKAIAAGDHVLFLGAVERFHYRDGTPLVFYAGRYGLPLADRLAA